MISGAHIIIYSRNPEADREFFRDILRLPNVDVGGGWLIFGLPPAELAFHPGQSNKHEFYFMCDDIGSFTSSMMSRHIPCEAIREESWGWLTSVTLPGGGGVGVYQPKHERPPAGL